MLAGGAAAFIAAALGDVARAGHQNTTATRYSYLKIA